MKEIVSLVGVVGLSFLLLGSAQGHEKEMDLREMRVTINVQEKPLWDVMMKLTDEYDIPIGLERSTLNSIGVYGRFSIYKPDQSLTQFPISVEERQRLLQSGIIMKEPYQRYRYTVNFQNARLATVLDEIVKQMEHYEWEIDDGVVNIFPVRGRDPRFESLMNLRISKFSLAKGFRFDEYRLQDRIFYHLPEVLAFMRENGFRPQPKMDMMWMPDPYLDDDISLTGATFKELLNAVIRVKRGGWILAHGGKTSDGRQEVLHLFI